MATTATFQAFTSFRERHGPAWGPRIPPLHESECELISVSEGLREHVDGPGAAHDVETVLKPFSDGELPAPVRLWVVREDDVVHADENCEFGATRAAGILKHTNLTGGRPAFSGGELLFLDERTIIISGDSGRYGPRSENEMHDAAVAFRDSGYTVYSAGYDSEAARAFPLIGVSARLA